ncbi:MAG TPA: addiction module toxin RelE, partial [Chryseobacterium sp.]|nr:addiction module toxin RelE [Chryseobacterium sp.]
MFLIKWMPEAEQEYYSNLEFWINHNKSREYSLKIISKVE